MKTSTQLKALIRNMAKEKNVEAEILLRNYMLERFLERIVLSEYKDSFILKGGMLIAAMVGIDARTTMDLDATIKGRELSAAEVLRIIKNILKIQIDDNILFEYRDIEEIREESDYPGYRISIEASLEKTRQMLKVDITTGDFVTPREVEYSFQLMFEDRAIDILAYNLETVLAEKLETAITRGVTNTRMRDFYDVFILTTTQGDNINDKVLKAALTKTAEKRHSTMQLKDAGDIIDNIANDNDMIFLWERYKRNYSYASEIAWDDAIKALKEVSIRAGLN